MAKNLNSQNVFTIEVKADRFTRRAIAYALGRKGLADAATVKDWAQRAYGLETKAAIMDYNTYLDAKEKELIADA